MFPVPWKKKRFESGAAVGPEASGRATAKTPMKLREDGGRSRKRHEAHRQTKKEDA